MSIQAWLLYVVTVCFVSATPGPNMLLAMTHGMQYGLRRTLITGGGLMAGLMIVMVASVLGLGALLAASEQLFTVVKYAGAGYLFYLGLRLWWDKAEVSGVEAEISPVASPQSDGALFRTGFLVSLSNPKAFLFFAALFPQFLDKTSAQGVQLAILVLTFLPIECMWLSIYAFGGRGAARMFGAPSRARIFNRVSGSIFIILAVLLLMTEQG